METQVGMICDCQPIGLEGLVFVATFEPIIRANGAWFSPRGIPISEETIKAIVLRYVDQLSWVAFGRGTGEFFATLVFDAKQSKAEKDEGAE